MPAMMKAGTPLAATLGGAGPNTAGARVAAPGELDARRIRRALRQRARYRFVTPLVEFLDDGYRIQSPCCSRNIDASGGMIDIAWLQLSPMPQLWRLHSKNHQARAWELQCEGRLHELLALLILDPQRIYWP